MNTNPLAYLVTNVDGFMGAVIDILVFILLVVIIVWAIKQFLGR